MAGILNYKQLIVQDNQIINQGLVVVKVVVGKIRAKSIISYVVSL